MHHEWHHDGRPDARRAGRARGADRASASAGVSAVLALVVAAACSSTSAQPARRMAQSDVVATVGSKSITLAELDDKALEQPSPGGVKLSQALYDARRTALDEMIGARLIDEAAKSQQVDRSALVEREITAKVRP